MLHADSIGQLETTNSGNRYILVFVDQFSKWVEACPLKAINAKSTINSLLKLIVSRHGVPQRLHTDQECQFESKIFNDVCNLIGIKHSHSTAYYP